MIWAGYLWNPECGSVPRWIQVCALLKTPSSIELDLRRMIGAHAGIKTDETSDIVNWRAKTMADPECLAALQERCVSSEIYLNLCVRSW